MESKSNRDFASYLDNIRHPDQEPELEADHVSPPVSFDYMSVAEELHSGRIQVQPDRRKRNDVENGDLYRAELEAYLDAAAPLIDSPSIAADLPQSIEPEMIAIELGLDQAGMADFARIRRIFAFANHPDRVAPHLRERAVLRMQVANMLIDDARSRARPLAKA